MCSYLRMWLWWLVLAVVTTSMCGFAANEHEVYENDNLKHDARLQAQTTASLKDRTESELSEDLSSELYRSIRFEPPQLDFGMWSVGMLRSHTVTLINHNRNRSVYLSSVSGRTPAFSSSFFDAKMVPPNSNTTFNVVFLPRDQGVISTNLVIHTSFGKLHLTVRGVGRECPYRLTPLVGIRAPLNATLMPEIHMYNPHNMALQILEVYSSGGQFQLELPSGDSEAPKGLWEIPPLTTKPVIRIRFQGHAAGNYSAFIRIKIAEPLNTKDSLITGSTSDSSSSSSNANGAIKDDEQILVIPVEFEILPQYGLYAVNPLIEFGNVAVNVSSGAATKVLKRNIFLKHSKTQLDVKDLEWKSITYINGIYVEGCQVIVLHAHEVDGSVVRLNEKLEVVIKDKPAHTYHSVELIIRADIFKGDLHYDVNKTLFLINTQEAKHKLPDENDIGKYDNGSSRIITFRNDFQIPLTIYNVTTQHNNNNTAKLNLQLKSFDKTGDIIILKPGHSFDILVALSLVRQQEEDLKDLTNYKTAIYIFTNITNFEIPVNISSARLFVTTQTLTIWRSNSSIYTKELDLGSILIREKSQNGFIIFQNRNSLPIKLTLLDFQKPHFVYYHALFLGCIKASYINETNNYTIDLEKADYEFRIHLNEGDIAVYKLGIQSYTTEYNSAYLRLYTLYENITIHVKFTAALGRLEVDQEKLHFPNCFPGKLCSSELNIRSTFKQPIHIKYINFTDSGLRFEDKNPLGSNIAPESVTNIGRIYFRPSALCGSRCYIQQQTDVTATFPNSNVANSLNIPNFDEAELRRRTELYRHFKYYFQNMDFTMTTKEMQHFQLNLMIELEWPQLVNGRQVLPTIEVNKTHIYQVKISNPSDHPILIDYSLADPTLAPMTRISLPLEVVVITPSCYLTDKAVFSLVNAPPKKPIRIPGLASISVPIKFQADYVGTICTLLHIRNNLTLYEGVWISAKTVQSQFRLGNRKPGSQTPLLFEISEQYLSSACPQRQEPIRGSGTEQHYVVPQVIARRVFTARNSGELPIRIDGFWIDDQPCQGYGFQIINCTSFELKANSSKKIEILFQADFSVTRISRPLKLKTNLTYDVTYTLVAQLPSNGLENCEFLLPRPPWEAKIRSAAIIMLLVTFVLVLVAVHVDYSNIIFRQTALYEARDKGTVHPTFNLRNIATRSIQNNTESSSASVENGQRNKAKANISASEKNDNSASMMMSLKKRNIKSSKPFTTEAKQSTTVSARSSMTLAEMMSWTFGSKSAKKGSTVNGNKNGKVADQANANAINSIQATNETKPSKLKMNEKSLLDKMDGDLKKSGKKFKVTNNDKGQSKQNDKIEAEEVKIKKDDAGDKEVKKEKNSPKLQTNTNRLMNFSPETGQNNKDVRENRKSFDSCSPNDNNDKSPVYSKENSFGRKMGKTPGRERRKQQAQNSSSAITDPTSSSCSSSTSSSCSSNHNVAAKRNERKTKVKAANSLKFVSNSSASNLFSTSFSASSSPTSMSANIFKVESTNSPVDILSPWSCGNHATFSDILQKSQNQRQTQTQQQQQQQQNQQSTISNDLMQQGSIFDLMSSSQNGMDNNEITAALTPKRAKNSVSDLGPIGSRKSPSSTPVWEPIQQSAITMQIPRPLNATTSTAPATVTSSVAPSSSCYFPMNTNFGYNDLTTSLSTQQQQQDIHAQLLLLQRKLLEQQQQQQQQQHQQFLNSNPLNNNWSNLTSPLWSSPMLSNVSASNNNHTSSASSSSIFSQPHLQNSTWSLTPNTTSAPASGLVRPPPGLEQNFPLNNNLASSSLNNQQTLSSAVASNSVTAFNNTTPTVAAAAATAQANSDNDNMPMFNLFGGLSSIWNDDWKQAATDQQQSTQHPQ